MKSYHIYILTNKKNTVLYTGVTSDLEQRVYEHKTKFYPKSFTAKYNCDKLIYFEEFADIEEAIHREKQLKRYKRSFKENLINSLNPDWNDLSAGWYEKPSIELGIKLNLSNLFVQSDAGTRTCIHTGAVRHDSNDEVELQ